jgi:hypothetical protein
MVLVHILIQCLQVRYFGVIWQDMETVSETASTVSPRSPFDRTGQKSSRKSKVGTRKLLPMADGRSAVARRFRDLVEAISADLGGMDYLSTGELQLVRRASMLSAECEKQEALAAREDATFDVDSYIVKTNALKRVLEVLGLKRTPRDITPSLSNYLQAKGQP